MTARPPSPDLPAELPIEPLRGPVDLDIAVPGSKSITNRAMILGALADGEVVLTHALYAEDTHYMLEALATLGYEVDADWPAETIRIQGRSGAVPARSADLYVGNAGTAMRFLTALVCLGHGRFRLDGKQRMRERPIGDLLECLMQLGVKAGYQKEARYPPIWIEACGLPGGRCMIAGSRSSQYITGLLMVAPFARKTLEIEITGEFVSRPYVELTLRTMSDFGVGTSTQGARVFMPTHDAVYRAGTYAIEGDATAASYFLAVAAILGGRVCITNLRADSPQGDVAFAKILGRMGCKVRQGFLEGNRGIEVSRDPKVPLQPVHVDLNDMPDVAQTLAAVCLFAEGSSSIINIANLRIKETDRLSALGNELTRLGAVVNEGPDFLEIEPGTPKDAKVETYDDHRMAMAMAIIGLARPGVTIKDPSCVAKTYPNYFKDLERLR